jgi:hypothetical protein
MSNVRPTLIAYTTKTKGYPEFDQFRVTFSNPTFFQNATPEGRYDYFYTESDAIREVYAIQNPTIKEFTLDFKEKPKRQSNAIETKVEEALKEKADAEQESEEETVQQEQKEEVNEPVEAESKPEIPDDYKDLSWPKLRSLASQFTDEKGINKERALEILAEAKGE